MTEQLPGNDEVARRERRRRRRERRGSGAAGPLFPGLLIMAVGIVFLLDNLDLVESGQVLRFWPVLLIALGVKHLSEARDRGTGVSGAVLAGVGGLLLLSSLNVIDVDVWQLWPLFLIVFGFTMLRRARWDARSAVEATDSAEVCCAFLGGVERRNRSADFRGGSATAFMGSVELDLTEADMADETAVIRVLAMWGGIEIRVPEAWALEVRVTPIMGGVEDKTRGGAELPTKRLVVEGTVLMAGIEVRN